MLESLNGSVPALQANSHGIQIHGAPVPPYIFSRCTPGCVAGATKTNVFIGRAFCYLDLWPKVPWWPRPPIRGWAEKFIGWLWCSCRLWLIFQLSLPAVHTHLPSVLHYNILWVEWKCIHELNPWWSILHTDHQQPIRSGFCSIKSLQNVASFTKWRACMQKLLNPLLLLPRKTHICIWVCTRVYGKLKIEFTIIYIFFVIRIRNLFYR